MTSSLMKPSKRISNDKTVITNATEIISYMNWGNLQYGKLYQEIDRGHRRHQTHNTGGTKPRQQQEDRLGGTGKNTGEN